MQKKRSVVVIVIILLILFCPIPATYKDGGTRTYTALTYKVIDWNKMLNVEEVKTGLEIHFFPNNFHNIDYYSNVN